ncbi:NUDIX hydrolase [Patescibacteria group bacterium]|nr:NUDIX hydrolase [Patescibacteria group bacterium]
METVKKKYEFAVIATDVVIFTVQNYQLKVLLINMKKPPFTGFWACPGGLVKPTESVEESAKRHLLEKTGVKDVYLEQLHTFGQVDRDPFGRVVSVAYFALIPSDNLNLHTTKEYKGVEWFPVNKLPKPAYDHSEIISLALDRLKHKITQTNIAYSLLPKQFTLGELQDMYELILDKEVDKRNFRKKILSLNLIRDISKKRLGAANRPAKLYKFESFEHKEIDVM